MTNSLSLKIGLDYHGVIDQKPECFANFCQIAQNRGHRIYIITGGPVSDIRRYLAANNIVYDFIFAVSDYYQALGRIEQLPDGSFEIPDYLWNMAKAEFCRRNGINFHIDDSEDYLHWFSTPFCLYKASDNMCYLSPGLKIDFSSSSDNVLDYLEYIAEQLTCFSFR